MMTISNIQDLGELVVAKGDTFNLRFVFKNEDGTLPDYTGFEGFYILSELGYEDVNVLSLQMNLQSGSTNTFTLNVITEDTQDLEARSYVVKVVLKDENDNLYKKARGIITIKEDSLEVT